MANSETDKPGNDMDNFYFEAEKFIAADPALSADPAHKGSTVPFILIPANFYRFVPLWGWVAIAISIILLIVGVLFMPVISLNRLISRLDDGDPANVQATMRQLIINSNDRTVGKLYEIAASPEAKMQTRLRAIDTLSLIRASRAEQALLRLELSHNTDTQIKEAAIAARKQRESTRVRER